MKLRSTLLSTAVAAVLGATLAGCQFAPPKPKLTPLQIQTMQTQTFQADKTKTFNAVTNALENTGYTIQNSNAAGGYINVIGQSHSAKKLNGGFKWHGINICTSGKDCTKNENQVTSKAVGNITVNSAGANRTLVRLNFTNHDTTSGSQGQNFENDEQILDPTFYQGLFSQIRQSLFVGQAATGN